MRPQPAAYCTCGNVVHGNGGKNSHRAMHKRRNDWQPSAILRESVGGHGFICRERFDALFPGRARGAAT